MGKALIIKGADFSANGIKVEYPYVYTWEQGGIKPLVSASLAKTNDANRIRTTEIQLKTPIKFSVSGGFGAAFFEKKSDGTYETAKTEFVTSGTVDEAVEGAFVLSKNNEDITPSMGSDANLIILSLTPGA